MELSGGRDAVSPQCREVGMSWSLVDWRDAKALLLFVEEVGLLELLVPLIVAVLLLESIVKCPDRAAGHTQGSNVAVEGAEIVFGLPSHLIRVNSYLRLIFKSDACKEVNSKVVEGVDSCSFRIRHRWNLPRGLFNLQRSGI